MLDWMYLSPYEPEDFGGEAGPCQGVSPGEAEGEGDSPVSEEDQAAVPSEAAGGGGGDSGDGGGSGSVGADDGEFQDPEVTFSEGVDGTSHGARHLEGYPLSQDDVEGAIEADVIERARAQEAPTSEGTFGIATVPVDDYTIQYCTYQLPQDRVNVGTYFPLEEPPEEE